MPSTLSLSLADVLTQGFKVETLVCNQKGEEGCISITKHIYTMDGKYRVSDTPHELKPAPKSLNFVWANGSTTTTENVSRSVPGQ